MNADEFLKSRGLSRQTLGKMNVGVVTKGGRDFLEFRHCRDGVVIGRKFRPTDEKTFRWAEDSEYRLWNVDQWVGPRLIITEGELDALALVEAGVSPGEVVSVPNGAKQQESADVRQAYPYIYDDLPALMKAEKIVLWTDNDASGRCLRNDLVRIFGKAKTYHVESREDAKDANGELLHGGGGVLHLLESPRPTPISGLFRLSDIAEPPEREVWSPGFPEWERKVGIGRGLVSVVTGYPGHGKALSLDTSIPTPNGMVKMGDLRAGDFVYSGDGHPTKIITTSEVMLGRPCYEIEFSTGQKVVADAEHLWLTETEPARLSERWTQRKRGDREHTLPRGTDQRHKKTYPSVVKTQEIAATLMYHGKRNHRIALCPPVQNGERDLSIDPYVLGVWLGDGTSRTSGLTCYDQEIVDEISRLWPGGIWRVEGQKNYYTVGGLITELRKINLADPDHYLGRKFIPDEYSYGSHSQRLSLLQGLMDTDGYCDESGHFEFTTIIPHIAAAVKDLMCSLGIRATLVEGDATLNGRVVSKKYRVCGSADIPVFRLPRKLNRQINNPMTERSEFRYITACNPVPSVAVKCIQVEAEDGMFLCTEEYIPTHNSVLWMQIWTQIAQNYGVKVCMASFETRAKPDHRRNIRSFIHRKLEKDMTDDERDSADRFNEGHFLWAEHPLQRADPRWLFDIWEVAVVRHGAAAVQLDPYNRLEHSRPDRMSETDYIGNFLSECGDFARDLNCHVQIIAHPSKLQQNRDRRAPWLSDISGSAHWDNRVDAGYVIHRPEMYKDGAPVTQCQFICRKARYPELGYPCNLDMDFKDGYYRSVDYDEVSL